MKRSGWLNILLIFAVSCLCINAYAEQIVRIGDDAIVYETAPHTEWVISGRVGIEANKAWVDLDLMPGEFGQGMAYLGPDFHFRWDGPYTWDQIKKVPVRVATRFSYQLSNTTPFSAVNIHFTRDGNPIFNDTALGETRGDTLTKEQITTIGDLGISYGVGCTGNNMADQDRSVYAQIISHWTSFDFWEPLPYDFNHNGDDDAVHRMPVTIDIPHQPVYGSIVRLTPFSLNSAMVAKSHTPRLYFINFGDSPSAELISNDVFIHAYDEAGEYTISVSVPGDFDFDADIDGADISGYLADQEAIDLELLAQFFGKVQSMGCSL